MYETPIEIILKKLAPALGVGTAASVATFLVVGFLIDAIKSIPFLVQIAAIAALSFLIAFGVLGIWLLFSYILYSRRRWEAEINTIERGGDFRRLPPAHNEGISLPAGHRNSHLVALFIIALVVALAISGILYYQAYLAVPNPNPTTSPLDANSYLYFHARGSLAVDSPLAESSELGWQTTSSCQFVRGAYHVSTSDANNTNTCSRPNMEFADFALEVKMTILKGDCGGVLFRGKSAYSSYYFYRVCQDQAYQLMRAQGYMNTNINDLLTNRDIRTGANKIGIIAKGNKIWLYMNEVQIRCIVDDSYTNGSLALAASSNEDNNVTEVAYSNLKIWTLTDGGDGECK